MKYSVLIFICLVASLLSAQGVKTPLEQKNFSDLTSYQELATFVENLKCPYLHTEIIGTTAQGRNIYALKFSKNSFGADSHKIKVLIFAQQHGNEQSGKEGALLLAKELIKAENAYLFDKIDFALIPQVNADGAEKNKRRNGQDADLNRNHLILEQPEVIALHRFYDQYKFQLTMDVHEYAPYFSEIWKKFGYRCNSDELIGVNTNCNIALEIRNFSNNAFVPFYRQYLSSRGFSNSLYAPGGPPGQDYVRHSTFDINDGRQSFGIQGSMSLIQEGLNGEDVFKDRIEHRAKGQMTGMRAVLQFAFTHSAAIRSRVTAARRKLNSSQEGRLFSLQMDHMRTGKQHPLPVYSYATGKDSIIMIKDYRPIVKSILDVKRPAGYLIPARCNLLVDWVKRHSLKTSAVPVSRHVYFEQYHITKIDSIDFETDMIINPQVVVTKSTNISLNDYIYVPLNQLKSDLVMTALEPRSELGLVTYQAYRQLLKTGESFPVIRVLTH